jgi:SAM-dependent methyltransferase
VSPWKALESPLGGAAHRFEIVTLPDWIREYFERGYAQRWGLAPPTRQVHNEVSGLWKLLNLTPGSRVLDLGCGHGRHAVVLAEHGARVVGVDVSEALVTRARDLATERGTRVRWVRGDMRQLPFRSECVTAAVLIDGFGFFETEEQNTAVLSEAARILEAGGRLALKVLNGGPVMDDFRETAREERDGVAVVISRTLSFDPPRMIEKITISGNRGHGDYERRQRLYMIDELQAGLERLGFRIDGLFADPHATPLERTSPAIWIVAQR